jgi:hypothetical protein
VGPRSDLDAVAKRKYPCPWRELNPGIPVRDLVTVFIELIRLSKLLVDDTKKVCPSFEYT